MFTEYLLYDWHSVTRNLRKKTWFLARLELTVPQTHTNESKLGATTEGTNSAVRTENSQN